MTTITIKQPSSLLLPQEFDTLEECIAFFAGLDDTHGQWRVNNGIIIDQNAKDVINFLDSIQ